MRMKLEDIAALHKRVVHTEWNLVAEKDVRAEMKVLDKLSPDVLVMICPGCYKELALNTSFKNK
jgi:hypothetical protein